MNLNKKIKFKINSKLKEKKWEEIISICEKEFPQNKNLLHIQFIRNAYIKSLINLGNIDKVKEIVEKLEFQNDFEWLEDTYLKVMEFEKAIDISKKNTIHSLKSFIKTQLKNVAILSETGENIVEYKPLLLPAYNYLQNNDKVFFEKHDPNGFIFASQVEKVDYITLIVSGAARSGTTAIGDLLNLSEEICLFKERYNPRFGYHPSMFEKKFLYAKPLMPHYKQYKDLETKYDHFPTYIGDKRPSFPLSKDLTFQNYKPEQIKIIHIIRNIYDVAFSYKKRAINASKGLDRAWVGSRGIAAACYEMNIINQKTIEMIEDSKFKDSVYIVDYENIFTNKDLIFKLFHWLNVNFDEEMENQLEKTINKAKKLKNKKRSLTEKEKEEINRLFDFDIYEKLKKSI